MVPSTVLSFYIFTYSNNLLSLHTLFNEDHSAQRENNVPTFDEGQSQGLSRGQTSKPHCHCPSVFKCCPSLALVLFLNSGKRVWREPS